jgi:hypothetical protein
MHEAAGNQNIIVKGLQDVESRLLGNSQELRQHLAEIIGDDDNDKVNAQVAQLSSRVSPALQQAQTEPSHHDALYVSRFDSVGLFQSALSKVFSDIPDLQGYGDKNPAWVTTLMEELLYRTQTFFERVHQDVRGQKKFLWSALVTELMRMPTADFRAPFPSGVPVSQPLPENVPIVLLGDWGGDNDAAKKIADVVRLHRASISIHLGDIYYGGTKEECETFLRLWPLREDVEGGASQPRLGFSWALNGNHEMYSGGEHYFNLVLKTFKQPQSFFCLENEHWRLIGLDTAYANGSMKPSSPDDPIAAQWNWLLDLLRDKSGRANILLTHHQPVSAHAAEWNDSKKLREEVDEILAMDGIGRHAIFGWFFGHEHRCAHYRDTVTPYNARLIGNGCIPHVVQHEKEADPGCTPVDFFNKLETHPGSTVAVSSFAKLNFSGPELVIDYCDENNVSWGTELWNSTKGRLNGVKFIEYDDIAQ